MEGHFLKLLFASFGIVLSLEVSAHSLVLSVYKLKYEKNEWRLYFTQKTRALRDAIYGKRPDLKGINLNAEVFLDETSKYISDHFILRNEDKLLKVSPIFLQYNGLNFEGQFSVAGLANHPDYLTIEASGFDAHAHSMKILGITLGDREYLYNFNQEQKQAIFAFDAKQYVSSIDKKPAGLYSLLLYPALALIMLGLIGIKIFRKLST